MIILDDAPYKTNAPLEIMVLQAGESYLRCLLRFCDLLICDWLDWSPIRSVSTSASRFFTIFGLFLSLSTIAALLHNTCLHLQLFHRGFVVHLALYAAHVRVGGR